MPVKRSISALCLALAVGAIVPSPAFGWGATGHRITGQIAQDNVNGRTRAEIERILGHEGLPEAATWPDEQKSSPEPFWRREAGPYHYVTLPPGAGIEALEHPPEGDAASALERFSATLRNPAASREDKALALRFIMHIVGDLHMPLHVGKEGDRGGNDFKVLWFNEPSNLHSVWDDGMISSQRLSYTEYSARLEARTTPDQAIAWWNADPATWMAESIELRDKVYPATGEKQGQGTEQSPVRLSWQYGYDWTPAMELRLQQAGIRIAAYLDRVFTPDP